LPPELVGLVAGLEPLDPLAPAEAVGFGVGVGFGIYFPFVIT
jgi:hypothetical protein